MLPHAILKHRKHTRRRAWTLLFAACCLRQASFALADAGGPEAACSMDAFLSFQGSNKTGGHCTTCLFPTYPGLESIDVATYKQMDFSDKWVYFLGDISIRQMYGEFAALVHRAQLDRNVGEPPHHTQHDCTSQQGRLLGYQPPPYDQTPCYLNEKTCSRHFAQTNVGANVTVTFDWKHLMYEDYDRALFETWKKEGGPHYVILSPGGHDCWHEPEEYEYHSLQAGRLAQHLKSLDSVVVWVDYNPTSFGAHGKPILQCLKHINGVAHTLAKELGLYMFSRQAMIVTGMQMDDSGHWPMHQPDSTVAQELALLLAWLSCVTAQDAR